MDGCDSLIVRRGWCGKHYQRWRRYGEPHIYFRPSTKKGDSTFSCWVRQYAKLQGETLADIDSKVGCGVTRLSQLHYQGKAPSPNLMKKIMDSMGVSSLDEIEFFLLS